MEQIVKSKIYQSNSHIVAGANHYYDGGLIIKMGSDGDKRDVYFRDALIGTISTENLNAWNELRDKRVKDLFLGKTVSALVPQ